ncbi:MAG TPA: PA2779 family protein [Noviherbaspirillum sp.]|nr:PA2779 family protein [Noviherbaspirillum sp.]
MIQKMKRLFVYFLLCAFGWGGFTQTVQAAIIGTDQIQAASAAQQNRARIAAALDRPEVLSQLEQMGVSKADAQARVAALTDEEAATMASQIDSLPAGGDIVGALLVVFFVLLVTDILGLTKVFPFTRSHR